MHVDVKKLGNIPDGDGWRYVGRHQGEKHRAATQSKSRNAYGGPKAGYAFVHTVIDDHSRVAYTEVHDDGTAVTAVGFLHRAVDWFADRGVTIEGALWDNGGAYRSYLWRDNCEALSITSKFTRPYRPRTNGKVERFHRTMADGWAYAPGQSSAAAGSPGRHDADGPAADQDGAEDDVPGVTEPDPEGRHGERAEKREGGEYPGEKHEEGPR